jgi:hypothetical protein
MAMPFKNFDDALKSLPSFIGGIDLVGQHKTISDLAFRVQHEMDLATEGEDNEITCKRQTDTTKRWWKCRAYLLRCEASAEIERGREQQMEKNLQIGEAAFQRFAEELKIAGVKVSEEHGIDLTTGKITFVSAFATNAVENALISAAITRLGAVNITVGVAADLRERLRNADASAFKLQDFGFRGTL